MFEWLVLLILVPAAFMLIYAGLTASRAHERRIDPYELKQYR